MGDQSRNRRQERPRRTTLVAKLSWAHLQWCLYLKHIQFHVETNLRHDGRQTDIIQRESDSHTAKSRSV